MITKALIESVLAEPTPIAWDAVSGVSIDTRTLQPGELYVAIRGEQLDGHDYLRQAAEAGAVAAMVDHTIENSPLPLLIVEDTTQALGQLAKKHRQSMLAKVVGITGSCGKTTTRAFTDSILSLAGNTLASVGSFNNNIGVPLTLLKMTPEHQYVVQEIGTNNPGEIAALTAIAVPDVAVITLAAPVHLSGLKDLDGVAKEKGSIYRGLNKQGIAIINHDDQFADQWRLMAGNHRVITFGLTEGSDLRATDLQHNEQAQVKFTLHTHQEQCTVQLQMLGQHNVLNALAAAAIAYALSVDLSTIKKGLQAAQAENRRLVTKPGIAGCQVIDDSYNANPVAMTAAIELLASFKDRRILVFADMGELGEDSPRYHSQVGEVARSHHIDALYCYGDLSRLTAKSFGDQAYHFEDKNLLIEQLKQELVAGATVLVKGSNSMKMNEVTQAIIKEDS
ncbi:MAG: UDP-N-acetylmuramoyl-tripeptide--D-alanyl-D-alanine ligase [Coxiellaceae bacterium]|nr:UDP-N-acetylmuramoyl-tripeptide--D-alanyl-D-alanine ligase [Coxiellaceae bacterium]